VVYLPPSGGEYNHFLARCKTRKKWRITPKRILLWRGVTGSARGPSVGPRSSFGEGIMQPTDSPSRILPPAWTEALERVQKSLGQALAEAEQRERALDRVPSNYSPAVDRAAAWRGSLGRLQERLERLGDLAEWARGNAGAVEEALVAAGEALCHWQDASRAVSQPLAERTASGVG
jgi:hypothetical protein